MKKYFVFCAAACMLISMNSCKPKESAYRQAYEKAKAQENAQSEQQAATDAPVVTPLVEHPATQTTVKDNADNATVRQEKVTVVNGDGLKNFSVVVGSFSLKANAEGLQSRLKQAGYAAQIAYNADRNLYRVVASTFNDKSQAVQSRDKLRSNYADAWLLYNK